MDIQKNIETILRGDLLDEKQCRFLCEKVNNFIIHLGKRNIIRRE